MMILISLYNVFTLQLARNFFIAQCFLLQTIEELKFLWSQPKYVASFLLNQTGAVLFMLGLGSLDLSLLVPVTNGLTFLVTTITGYLLGEGLTKQGWVGVALLSTGLGCCAAGKATT